ncbi:MAG: hypothetical protein KKC75_08420 [Nanoarchaeota archaeon]|nr:hypothetical protein [Nanoarchaeota archaeon]MBU1004496.1 hypothetical protein [Nanoarchaeota archaeon]MBU1945666.1 hypothetical protein [Nanoarchaeota archaeon]
MAGKKKKITKKQFMFFTIVGFAVGFALIYLITKMAGGKVDIHIFFLAIISAIIIMAIWYSIHFRNVSVSHISKNKPGL